MTQLLGVVTPSDSVYAAVGKITLYWTYIEYTLENLIWRYVGDVDIGHMFTSQLGNTTLTEILETMIAHEESDALGRETIQHAIEGFHVLRLNRNKIVHSFNFFVQPGAGVRFSGRRKVRVIEDFDEYLITIDQLNGQVSDLATWGTFLHNIVDAVSDRRFSEFEQTADEWRPWPDKPPLPHKLEPLRLEARKGKARPRRSSPE
jgi:hypothetical protein